MASKSSEIRICAFDGCERQVKTAGFCGGHYQQHKAGKTLTPLAARAVTLCAFEGCGRAAVCKSLCDGHYQQLRSGRELQPLQQIHVTCTFPGCENPHDAKGLCASHYSQMKDRGTLRPVRSKPSLIEVQGLTATVTLYGLDDDGRLGAVVDHTKIDTTDVAEISKHRWQKNSVGYASSKIEGKRVLLHRMLVNPPDDMQVDHIDGNPLNNCRANLRIVTQAQNAQNKKPWGETGHRGVTYEEDKDLYRVVVTKDGVRHSGGRHKKLEDAVAVATALRNRLHTHNNEARSVVSEDE